MDGVSNEEPRWVQPPTLIADRTQRDGVEGTNEEFTHPRNNDFPKASAAVSPGHGETTGLNPVETKVNNDGSTQQYFSEPGSKEQFYKKTNSDGSWAYYRDDGKDAQGRKTATPLMKVDKDGNVKQLPEGNRNLYDQYKESGVFDKFEKAMARKSLDYNPPPVIPSEASSDTEVKAQTEEAPKEEAKLLITDDTEASAESKTETSSETTAETGTEASSKTETSTETNTGETEASTKTGAREPAEGSGEASQSEAGKEEKPTWSFTNTSFSDFAKKAQDLATEASDEFSKVKEAFPQERTDADGNTIKPTEQEAQIRDQALRSIINSGIQGKKGESLETFTKALAEIRALPADQRSTKLSAEEQLKADKQSIEKLISGQLPEDKQHLAGIAASLLVQAQDNPETKDVNELSELTNALATAPKDGKVDISSIFSKADAALGHLDREQLAEVYSNVVEKQLHGELGLKDMLTSEGIDPKIADTLLESYSKPLGDIFSRLSPEERANVVDLASKFGAEGVDHNKVLDALSGNEEAIKELGLEPEQIRDAKIALVNGGLNFLKDEIGLTQAEVDKMSQLYKLSEGMMGADGKFNEADIPALAATLGINDLKTLSDAKGLIEATIMSQVSKTAHSMAKAEATRQYNNHPDVQRGRRMLQRPLVRFFAGGMIRSELSKGWGKAMGIANREASKGINQVRSNLGDDLGPMSRAMTAIETRDQLREGLGIKESDNGISPEEAGKYFAGLSKESLASLAGDKEKLKEFLSTAEKNFNALSRASIEAQVSSSIKASRDIKGDIKDQLLGLNKYFSILDNYENRNGMTQTGLKQAQEGLQTAQNVLDRALGVTNDADRVKVQDAAEMFEKYQAGELGIGDLPPALQRFIDPSLAPQQADPAEIAKQEAVSNHFSELKDFVAGERPEATDFTVFKHDGKEYLGYTDRFGPGYVRENADGSNTRVGISESIKNKSYQAALKEGGSSAFADTSTAGTAAANSDQPLRIDESLFDGKADGDSYTQEVAEKFGQNKDPEYLAKYGMTAFHVNGKEYLGYIAIPENVDSSKLTPEEVREQGKLAFIDEKGQAQLITDEATKAAYYGAMMRDGQDISSIRQFGTVDSKTQNEIFAIASSRKATDTSTNNNYSNSSSGSRRYSNGSRYSYGSSYGRRMRSYSGTSKPTYGARHNPRR